MSIAPRLRRGLAAALSALALLSAAARPVLACEMGRADAVAALPDHGAHAQHGSPSQLGSHATDHVPNGTDVPRPLGCDHLVSCASMVVIAAPWLHFAASSVPEAAPQSVAVRHDAPVRALEPPPPRA